MDAGTRLSAGLYIFSRSACSMAGAGHASCHSLYRLVYNIYESCQRKYSFIDNDIADKFHTPDHSPASVYLHIFGVFEWVSFSVVFSMILTLIIPLGLAVVIKLIFPGEYLQRVSAINPVVLSLAVLSIFASERETLFNNLNLLQIILIPISLFFIINFIIGNMTAKIFKFNYRDTVSLVMITMARNSPLALAIAVVVFDDMPIITLALIIGPLIEIPILAVTSRIMQIRM